MKPPKETNKMKINTLEIAAAISAEYYTAANEPHQAARVAERCGYLIDQLNKVYNLEIFQGGTEESYAIGDVMNLVGLIKEQAEEQAYLNGYTKELCRPY